MLTIQTNATITKEGMLLTVQVHLPAKLLPGEHPVVLVVSEDLSQAKRHPPSEFSVHPVGLISEDFTFRREDLYSDDGR